MRHYVFGGRYGDVIHSIPTVWEYCKRTGEKVRFTCAQEFAGVLEGCAYIELISAPVPWDRINDIINYAKNMYPRDEYVNMACYGKDYSPGYETWSFLRESWRLSKCPEPPETQALFFDRRSPVREATLVRNHLKGTTKPVILVSTCGRSSPFSHSQALHEDIRQARPDAFIVDLNDVKAEKVYDLVGLFEKAEALVTIDTMHLHLSAAVPSMRVYSLITNGLRAWNRSDWRPQHVWRCLYSEFLSQRAAFREALVLPHLPMIHHTWTCGAETDGATRRRLDVAQASWRRESDWAGTWTMEQGAPTRFLEGGKIPFVKDLIDAAARRCRDDNDIISISNADIGCVHGVTGRIMDAMRANGCAFAHRWDAQRIDQPIQSEAQVSKLGWYPGSDWFWMTLKWWKQHREEMPDMVVGREFWDAVLRQLMKKFGGAEIESSIWHEKHTSTWDRPGNRENLEGNKHNRSLAMKWFALNRSDDRDPYRTTWDLRPGVTQPASPPKVHPAVAPRSNIVLPNRFRFVSNNPFRR